MDFLSKAYSNIADLLKSMTPAARITTALLLGAIVVCLMFLFSSSSSKASYALFGGQEFAQEDLAQMETLFGAANLGNYEIRGARMYVPRGNRAAYLKTLTGSNLTTGKYKHTRMGIEGNSIFDSRQMRTRRAAAYKEIELAKQVESLDAIAKAYVKVDATEEGRLRRTRKMTASVIVTGVGGRPIDADIAHSVRLTLASAYAGLSVNDVTVTDSHGQIFDHARSGPTMNIANDPYAAHKEYFEQRYRQKIVSQLSDIPGVKVEVNIDLNTTERSTQRKTAYDPSGVVTTRADEETDTRSSSRPSTGGPPGLASNGLNVNTPAQVTPARRNEDTRDRSKTSTTTVPTTTETNKWDTGLHPERGIASIRIPDSYVIKTWQQSKSENADKEPSDAELSETWEEIKKEVADTVVGLLPETPPGDNPYPQVIVTKYKDGMNTVEMPKASAVAAATGWLGNNWQSLGMAVVGLFSLIMLRGMVKANASDPASDDIAANLPPPVEEEETADDEAAAAQSKVPPETPVVLEAGPPGPNLREELMDLVRADPDGALSKLRNWLREVA